MLVIYKDCYVYSCRFHFQISRVHHVIIPYVGNLNVWPNYPFKYCYYRYTTAFTVDLL